MKGRQIRGDDSIYLRSLSSQGDYEAAVAMQQEIWGADVRDTVPICIMQVVQEVGGIAEGAFLKGDVLAGFVFGLTGIRNGRTVHWSHLLAVGESWRDSGIGWRLKAHQRDKVLELGVTEVYWTFDPLEARNAHLNLNKLDAVVTDYVPHFYGSSPVADTDTVIGTDRFIVRWDLLEPSMPSRSPLPALEDIPSATASRSDIGSGLAVDCSGSRSRYARIEIPPDIQGLKLADPAAAAEWRELTREAFLRFLSAGYHVAEFRVGSESGGGWYILEAQGTRAPESDTNA